MMPGMVMKRARAGVSLSGWSKIVGVLLTSAIAVAASSAQTKAFEPPSRSMVEAVDDFAPRIDAFVGALAIEREAFRLRANRCWGPAGDERNDIYYIWIGVRGVAPLNNAADVIEGVHAQWIDQDWDVTRYRHLDNGGVNLAARNRETGDVYMLDSGLSAGPERYVLGFFSTPCFSDPAGEVAYGDIK